MLLPCAVSHKKQRSIQWEGEFKPDPNPPVWSPLQLANLVAWYDFADRATLFKDIALLNPVTAHGDVIKTALDKSGNGYHLVQPSRATQNVTYFTDGFAAGLGSMYTWLDSGLYTNGNNLGSELDPGCTITAVQADGDSGQGGDRGLSLTSWSGVSDQQEWILHKQYYGHFSRWCNAFGAGYTGSVLPTLGLSHQYRIRIPAEGARGEVRYLGVETPESADLPNHDSFANFGIGQGTFGSDYLNGKTMEVVIAKSLTTAEETALSEYLALKWSVAGN